AAWRPAGLETEPRDGRVRAALLALEHAQLQRRGRRRVGVGDEGLGARVHGATPAGRGGAASGVLAPVAVAGRGSFSLPGAMPRGVSTSAAPTAAEASVEWLG